MKQDGAFTQVEVEVSIRRVAKTLAGLAGVTGPMNLTGKDRVSVSPAMQVQFNTRFTGEPDRTIAEVIMAHALESEQVGPGSFTCCLQAVTEGLQSPSMEWHKDTEKTSQSLLSSPPSSEDVDRILGQFSASIDARTREMLHLAITSAGFGGRVIIERSRNSTPSLEHVIGYTFSLAPAIESQSLHLVRPRVFCIDGIIEQVSEVHHLLEAAADAKEPVLLFVRGLSEDVKHTLKVNNDRGSLCVIPITVRFDFEGINTLADISTIAGSEVTCAAKGDLISSIKFTEGARVDSARTGTTGTVLSNTATRAAVGAHVRRLREKRAEQDEETIARLYDTRIRSLSSNHVIIRLPDDKDFIIRSQAIDRALRGVRSLVEHGTTPSGELTSTDVAVRTFTSRCISSLQDLGAVLVRP